MNSRIGWDSNRAVVVALDFPRHSLFKSKVDPLKLPFLHILQTSLMTARRQASTTSLSKFERSSSPALRDGSLDFCNAFWGVGDGGVDVLFARMRGATRTIEELRNFWKERYGIRSWAMSHIYSVSNLEPSSRKTMPNG